MPKCPSIRHGHVKSARNRFIIANTCAPSLAIFLYSEIFVRFEYELFIREKIEAIYPINRGAEIAYGAGHLENDRPLRSDPERIFTQGEWVTILIKHIP